MLQERRVRSNLEQQNTVTKTLNVSCTLISVRKYRAREKGPNRVVNEFKAEEKRRRSRMEKYKEKAVGYSREKERHWNCSASL